MRKYKIEKLLDIELSKMSDNEIVNVTVKELFKANDSLIIYGFWVGIGITTFLAIVSALLVRFGVVV